MSLLFRIIYAAHANGTHHKLALDGLSRMQSLGAEAWQPIFLKHAEKFLEGSKAPDNTFKDFKNHVLHVSDNYWGGAPEQVEAWYLKTVEALSAQKWEEAVYAAGVLSHYYSDPLMPFHTGQTEAENAMHRACEWSINRSYDALHALGEQRYPTLEVKVPDGPHWLKDMTVSGAEFSHRYYEKLLAHYNLTRGVVRPEEGLDDVARGFIAELLIYAAEGIGHLFDRAIAESGAQAPDVSLALDTVLATLKIPQKMLAKRLSNAEDRRVVEAMYDELKATGRVDKTLPEDDRIVRELYAKEVLAPKSAKRAEVRAKRLPSARVEAAKPAVAQPVADARAAVKPSVVTAQPQTQPAVSAPPTAIPPPVTVKVTSAPVAAEAAAEPLKSVPPGIKSAGAREIPQIDTVPDAAPPPAARDVEPVAPLPRGTFKHEPHAKAHTDAVTKPEPPVEAPAKLPAAPKEAASSVPSVPPPLPVRKSSKNEDAPRLYLTEDAPLEDAPSIGPKMAARFAALGVKTVGDFLSHDPADMAGLLDDSRIKTETIEAWQDQAHLVLTVPGLRGTHAQLLVGAGYRSPDAIAEADPVALSADILKFATTSEGKHILRDGQPPDLEKIKAWVGAAGTALAA